MMPQVWLVVQVFGAQPQGRRGTLGAMSLTRVSKLLRPVRPSSPGAPAVVVGGIALLWVLVHLDAPLVEDGLFWWVPKGLLAAERGPRLVLAGDLPRIVADFAARAGVLPHQWSGGLPDYAHPPLWYWWLGLFLRVSPTARAVHLACLVPAVLAAAGFGALGARLGHRWAGLAVLCLPPVLAQFLRADLDLPLLAIVPWAMLALVDRRWRTFAVLGFLAPWLKEPGVLLVVPAVWVAGAERRWRGAVLAPLLGLGSWALVHGGLARPESLPHSAVEFFRDVPLAARIVFWEQGRWLMLAGLPLLFRRGEIAVLVGAWVVFFAVVGFFAAGGAQPYTHVRYFLPGMAVAAVAMAGRWPALALLGFGWLHARSPFGPEASLFGIDAARAGSDAAAWLGQEATHRPVWVGSYLAASLTQPWAGAVLAPVMGLHAYGPDTRPDEVPSGAVIVQSAYGEPLDALEHGLSLRAIRHWTRGEATVTAWTVE